VPENAREPSNSQSPPAPRKRQQWVDAAKGLGIITVVYGHLYPPRLYQVHDWIYLFHMPLFFMLSGMFQKPSAIASGFWSFLKHKLSCRLGPYLMFSAISLALWFGVSRRFLPPSELHSWSEALSSLVLGRPVINGPLWFFVCLFCAELFAYPFLKLPRAYGLLAAGLLVLALLNPWFPPEDHPGLFEAGVALVATPFLLVGYFLRDAIAALATMSLLKRCSFAVIFLIPTTIISMHHLPISMRMANYGNLPGFYAGALCGCAMVICLAGVLQHSRLLCSIGRASALIFALHYLLRQYVTKGVKIVLFRPLQGVDQSAFFAAIYTIALIAVIMLLDKLFVLAKSYALRMTRDHEPSSSGS